MATRKSWFDQQQDKRQAQSLQSGVIGGQTPIATQDGQAKGTAFTNLQTYLDTNKGAGTGIADAALKSTNESIDQTKTDVNAWADQAKTRVDDATLKDFGGRNPWTDQIKQDSLADLTTKNQEFQSWKQLGNYWGAKDATGDQGYSDVLGKSKSTEDKIANANTWQGQQSLMKDTFGKDPTKRYSSGMGTLDAFVARGDAQNKFDAFKDNNKNFGDTFKTAKENVNTYAGGAAQRGGQNYKNVMDAISGRIGTIQGDYNSRADTANKKFDDDADLISGQIKGGYNKDFKSNLDHKKYVTKVAGTDMATQAEIDALNMLGGWDDDTSTGNYARGSGTGGWNEAAYKKDLADEFDAWSKAQPKTPPSDGSDNPVLNKPKDPPPTEELPPEVKKVIEDTKDDITPPKKPEEVPPYILDAGNTITDTAQKGVDKVHDNVNEGIDWTQDKVTDASNTIKDKTNEAVDHTQDKVTDASNTVTDKTNEVLDHGQSKGNEVIDWVQGKIHTGNDTIDSWIDKGTDTAQQIGDKVVDNVQGVSTDVANTAVKAGNDIVDEAQRAADNAADTAVKAGNDVVNAAQKAADDVKDKGQEVVDKGQEIVTSVFSGGNNKVGGGLPPDTGSLKIDLEALNQIENPPPPPPATPAAPPPPPPPPPAPTAGTLAIDLGAITNPTPAPAPVYVNTLGDTYADYKKIRDSWGIGKKRR